MITYDTYSQKIFSEHLRRQQSLRSAAKYVRWTYPLFLLSFCVFPIFAVVQGLRLAYVYDFGSISEIIPRNLFVDAMPIVYVVTATLAFFALVIGLMWGSSKSHHYTFEAESLDLKTRQEYHLLCISKFLESVSQQINPTQPNSQTTWASAETKESATPGAYGATKQAKKQGASSAANNVSDDPLSQIVIHSEGSDNDHEIRI